MLDLGTFTDVDRLFDVLSLAADQAEEWEGQLLPLEDEDDELDIYDIFGQDDEEDEEYEDADDAEDTAADEDADSED